MRPLFLPIIRIKRYINLPVTISPLHPVIEYLS